MLDVLRTAGISVVKVRPSAVGAISLWINEGFHYIFAECDNDGDTAILWNHPDSGLGTWFVSDCGESVTKPMAETIRLIQSALSVIP